MGATYFDSPSKTKLTQLIFFLSLIAISSMAYSQSDIIHGTNNTKIVEQQFTVAGTQVVQTSGNPATVATGSAVNFRITRKNNFVKTTTTNLLYNVKIN